MSINDGNTVNNNNAILQEPEGHDLVEGADQLRLVGGRAHIQVILLSLL